MSSEQKEESQLKFLEEKVLTSKKLMPRASFESLARIHDVDKSVVVKILTPKKNSSKMATPAKKIRKSPKNNLAESTFCDENDSASSSSRSYETLHDAIKSNASSDLYKEGSTMASTQLRQQKVLDALNEYITWANAEIETAHVKVEMAEGGKSNVDLKMSELENKYKRLMDDYKRLEQKYAAANEKTFNHLDYCLVCGEKQGLLIQGLAFCNVECAKDASDRMSRASKVKK